MKKVINDLEAKVQQVNFYIVQNNFRYTFIQKGSEINCRAKREIPQVLSRVSKENERTSKDVGNTKLNMSIICFCLAGRRKGCNFLGLKKESLETWFSEFDPAVLAHARAPSSKDENTKACDRLPLMMTFPRSLAFSFLINSARVFVLLFSVACMNFFNTGFYLSKLLSHNSLMQLKYSKASLWNLV